MLLELLMVMGMAAILLGIVIVALNPRQQLLSSYDIERTADAKELQHAGVQRLIRIEKHASDVDIP